MSLTITLNQSLKFEYENPLVRRETQRQARWRRRLLRAGEPVVVEAVVGLAVAPAVGQAVAVAVYWTR